MREEYDFSKGKRGVYSRDLKDLHFPVYLDPQLEEYYKKIALKKIKILVQLLIRSYKKKWNYTIP
ncbi:toxin-antitoxin system, antitoxin component [Leptospira yasudae]|nr:toxin-antitoxin system, antitoxin component [Leptospira yasudae]TGM01066.1 toxin-antitoxin system, antitoxin component [Leptospira yasudae]